MRHRTPRLKVLKVIKDINDPNDPNDPNDLKVPIALIHPSQKNSAQTSPVCADKTELRPKFYSVSTCS